MPNEDLRQAVVTALQELRDHFYGKLPVCTVCRGTGEVQPGCPDPHCGVSYRDHTCPPPEPCARCEGTGELRALEMLAQMVTP